MKYTSKTFTLPASGKWTTDINWDRAFLSPEDFFARYGESPTPDKPVAGDSK